ncbi:MAG: sensor of ECF-type sigma factor, partial [Flavobacterium sp.]|nr:sensor of ECF-type sigma factor [Flavobacterium sp.]
MKKITTILLLTIFTTIISNAQRIGEKKEKLKSLKIAYITTELSLTNEESIKFWPIFNAFENKQREIRSLKTKSYINKMSDEDLDKMTDKDANNLLSQLESTEDDLFQNRKKLIT